MPLPQDQKKRFKKIGHYLKPVVMVAEKGLTKNVIAELDQALENHELIKIKLAIQDRDDRSELLTLACQETQAELVQSIGKTALIYRAAKKPNPKLSNILRSQAKI